LGLEMRIAKKGRLRVQGSYLLLGAGHARAPAHDSCGAQVMYAPLNPDSELNKS